MNIRFRCLGLGIAFMLCLPAARAQVNPPSGSFDVVFTKIFGQTKAFSSRADIAVKENKGEIRLAADFALNEDKMRMDIDLGQVKGPEVPAERAGEFKKMGMDKMAVIVDRAGKRMQVMYPALKSYADMPLPKEQADKLDKEPKIARTELGKETVEGHDCAKFRYTFTDEQGTQRQALVWHAAKLKDFPVKIQTTENNVETTILFKDVKFQAPAADLFNPPQDYTKYANIMEMMQAVMLRQMMQPQR